jgi:tripartite-type tricarboxylate transporter receptor subunit TctC
MTTFAYRLAAVSLGLAASLAFTSASHAQSAADFYKGKTLTMTVGFPAGSGYDLYARLVERHFSGHLPGNPNIVVQNMPGATSLVAAEHLRLRAPHDGLTISALGRNILTEYLLQERPDGKGLTPQQLSEFNWIGNANQEASVCFVWATNPVKSVADMKGKSLKFGSTGPGSDYESFALLMNAAFGTKLQIVRGYPGPGPVQVAIEQGELDGVCGFSWSSLMSNRPEWVRDKKITLLVQMNLTKHADLQNVPLATDLARNDEDRHAMKVIFSRQTLGRPYAAPPKVPADRVAALRAAFNATMKDPALLAEAKKARLDINPTDGAEMDRILKEVYAAPEAVVKRARAMIKGQAPR